MSKLLSAIEYIWGTVVSPFILIENSNERYEGLLARLDMGLLTKKTSYYYQYFRMKKKLFVPLDASNKTYEDYAIILQGQVIYDENFTLETAFLYKKMFPGVKVIISTWNDEKEDFFSQCEKAGIICVKDQVPEERGAGNLNCQLKSTQNGLKKAQSLGVKFAAKTRTDQRFFYWGWLDYVDDLIHCFKAEGNKQKGRIVFLESNGSYKYIAFHICDFFSFGHIEDLINLYGISYDTRENDFFRRNKENIAGFKRQLAEYELRKYYQPVDYTVFGQQLEAYKIAEYYILSEYYKKWIDLDVTPENMLTRYWGYLKNYAIVADSFQMQFYWPKYRRKYEIQSKIGRDGKLDFAGWMTLLNWELDNTEKRIL